MKDAPKPLRSLVEELCSLSTGEFDDRGVMPVLEGASLRPEDLEPYRFWKPDGYCRNLIFKNPLFEMALMCWDVGQESAIHNHSGEEGWVLVVEGTLEVTNYRLVTCTVTEKTEGVQPTPCASGCHSVLEELDRLTVPAGSAVAEVGDEVHIHKIANPASRGQRAMSLHIYSRPLSSCVVYDLDGESCRRVELAYDTEQGEPLRPGLIH